MNVAVRCRAQCCAGYAQDARPQRTPGIQQVFVHGQADAQVALPAIDLEAQVGEDVVGRRIRVFHGGSRRLDAAAVRPGSPAPARKKRTLFASLAGGFESAQRIIR